MDVLFGVFKFWLKWAASFLLIAVAAAVEMVSLSAAHADDHRVPAFGFWTCFWLTFGIFMVSWFVRLDVELEDM